MLHLVDEAVLTINPPGPATFQFMLQGLRFPGATERLPLNIADQANDPKGLRPILFHPPREVSSNAAASNSKFLNGFVEREPLLTLLRFQ